MSDIQLENENPVDSSNDTETPQETTGTKIGEVSDFEKELIQSEVIEESVPSVNLTQPATDADDNNVFATHLTEDFNDYVEGDIVLAK